MRKKIVSLLAALLLFLSGWVLAWEMDRRLIESLQPTPTDTPAPFIIRELL